MGCCCVPEDGTTGPRRPWGRRIGSLATWAAPLATLALVPKCPGCVAGYLLLFTGVGVSLSAAAAVRWGLIVLSVGVMALLAWRAVRRVIVR